MALVARLTDENTLSQYFDFINKIDFWFYESFLKLNISKTKELCPEGHRAINPNLLCPVEINSQHVEQVESFKYLGTVIDNNLSFTEHVDHITKKANQRMYLLRKLRSFNVSTDVLSLVYVSLIQSILSFNIVSWFGHTRVKDRARLNRVVNTASKIIGRKQKSIVEIHRDFTKRKARKVLTDDTHPLHSYFVVLRSGRRLRTSKHNRNLLKFSFVPSAISIINCDGII